MHFYEFIKSLEPQEDEHIIKLIMWIKNDKTFPKNTSDPSVLAIYLYLYLNEEQTTAYQKLLMLYRHLVPNHKLPKRSTSREDMFLQAINLIVCLQNNDSNYKYHGKLVS